MLGRAAISYLTALPQFVGGLALLCALSLVFSLFISINLKKGGGSLYSLYLTLVFIISQPRPNGTGELEVRCNKSVSLHSLERSTGENQLIFLCTSFTFM